LLYNYVFLTAKSGLMYSKGAFTPRSRTVAYWVRNCMQLYPDEYADFCQQYGTRESTQKIKPI